MSVRTSALGCSSEQSSRARQPLWEFAPAADATAGRNAALDFTKGALVLCMVAYHSLNYSSRPELGFQLMAFLPPSFIVITGFLVSRVYFARPVSTDGRTRARLVCRGLKLLLIFTLLNLLTGLVKGGGRETSGLWWDGISSRWLEVYLTGNGALAAFEVLLPIAYLLMLGPLFLWLHRTKASALVMVSIVVICACALLGLSGWLPLNAALLSAGLLGLALGRLTVPALETLGRAWWLCLIAYAGYLGASVLLGQSYLMQLAGACAALAALYGLGNRLGTHGRVQRTVQLLGCYSLLSYIAQIAFLQLLAPLAGRPNPASVTFLALFSITLMLTWVAVELTDWARRRYSPMDQLYKLVFA